MIALQDILEKRDDLQLILMSATMPTRDLAEYWCGVGRRRQLRRREQQLDYRSENQSLSITLDDDDWGDDAAIMPTEINIPGRTFPVQSFFLEDVLTMTGFVDDLKDAEAADMAQIENDLMTLLSTHADSTSNYAKANRGSRNDKTSSQSPPASLSRLENSLTCVICNRSGFKSAEEFGTHVAFCDGGGKSSMEELEEKVRAFDATSIFGFDTTAVKSAELVDSGDVNETFDVPEEEVFEDYDEDIEPEKWSGDSPFVIDNVGPSNKPSLTEEEMLTKYHTMYDDEEINYGLVLDLVRYIVKSSYGDGAILIFFRKCVAFGALVFLSFPHTQL